MESYHFKKPKYIVNAYFKKLLIKINDYNIIFKNNKNVFNITEQY